MARIAAVLVGAGALALGSVVAYGAVVKAADAALHQQVEAHRVEFPVPFPLTPEELAELPAGADPTAVAKERALERAKHMLESRYLCAECHGDDMSGGTMIDDGLVGRFRGPNLTRGAGSVVADYTTADWDRAVRHGLRKDGTASFMPAIDFRLMADRDLSDLVVYFEALPPVDNVVDPVLEPSVLGLAALAAGVVTVPALAVAADGERRHPLLPPTSAFPSAYGAYLLQGCVGCHRENMEGGKIGHGPPGWARASNLTPGGPIAAYSDEDFKNLLRTGKRRNGTAMRPPMDLMPKYSAKMTEEEMSAMLAYLRSVPRVGELEQAGL